MNTRTKAILAFSTIFILGFGSGFLFSDVLPVPGSENSEVRSELRQRGPDREFNDRDEPDIGRIQDYFSRILGLTSDQRDPFFDRISEYRITLESEIVEIRNRESDMLRDLYSTFRSDISEILNEDQLQKLDNQFHPDSVRFRRMRGDRP